MIAERARLVTVSYLVADLAATTLAFVAAHALRTLGGQLDGWLGPVYTLDRYWLLLAVILPLWIVVFHVSGLYGARSQRALVTEYARVARALTAGGLLLIFVIFAAKLDYISRPLILLFLVLNFGFVIAGRALVRAAVLDTSTRRRVLVAGGHDEVLAAAAQVDAHRDWGLEIVGLVSDGTWTTNGGSYAVLGGYESIPSIVQEGEIVDEVLVVPASRRLDDLKMLEPLFLQLEELGVVTRLVVNFLPQALSRVSFDELGGTPILTFSTAPRDELLLFVRRAIDVLVSSIALVILSPLLVAIALAIKATSRGPVLFKQVRCGLYGRPFTFLKFRSMRLEAETLKPTLAPYNEMDGPAFKMRNDPRVTAVGRFLRRTSLDELPQLWNILKGSMSFVGPRPSVIEEVRQYEPWQRRRLSMQPGLTCLWQISGRNDLTFDEWMRLDLEYIDNWSLWLDVKIALKTIPAVLLGRGAR